MISLRPNHIDVSHTGSSKSLGMHASGFPESNSWLETPRGLEQHTNCGELPPHMENHNNRHHQRHDMYSTRRHLEDDGVRQLDIPGITISLDADAIRDGRDMTHTCTKRQRCGLTKGREVAERHLAGLLRWQLNAGCVLCMYLIVPNSRRSGCQDVRKAVTSLDIGIGENSGLRGVDSGSTRSQDASESQQFQSNVSVCRSNSSRS